ncbi:Cytoplasmic glyoxalase II [Teratosphaeriaceae sp. CCFEE 6253]|nr:Cytoplasmic glyoxalase II [Teratosphaeriaceae sp. CCFEE 6253]
MDAALNKTLAALPDDTKVYPGHEYTKSNVKFAVTVDQSEPIKKLQSFASANKQTQGKFTIGDEKASPLNWPSLTTQRVHETGRQFIVCNSIRGRCAYTFQDPTVQKFTGKTSRVDVMSALREAKNSM